jgi:alpha-D-ribose 1-methylphosphonate 5-phosphate C-P lyase
VNTETLNPEPVQMIMLDPSCEEARNVFFVVDEYGSIQEKIYDGVCTVWKPETYAQYLNIDEKEVQRTNEAYTIPE